MRFVHLKRILKLDRLRLRGSQGAQDEFVLAAIAQNLRRFASLVARPPPAQALGRDDVPLVAAKPIVASPQANPDSEIRRDYELALQLGTRDGWTAFLNRFPSGFYADLANGQLNKIAAEEARVATADKARRADEEKARLAAERANRAEQEKAAAAAKAAEEKRLAAEKAKQIEEAKTAAAEQRRKEAELVAAAKALADKQVAEKALAEKLASEKAATELAAKQAAEKQESASAEQKVAAIAPTSTPFETPAQEMTKLVPSELRRVGCLSASADGNWNASSQRSLALFNRYAGTKLDAKLASFNALDAIKTKPGRVCPLVCERGFRADGDRCVRIACRSGLRVNDHNECEKIPEKKPATAREDSKPRDDRRKQVESTPAEPQSSGQILCNQAGCRPVKSGCRLLATNNNGKHAALNAGGAVPSIEVCD